MHLHFAGWSGASVFAVFEWFGTMVDLPTGQWSAAATVAALVAAYVAWRKVRPDTDRVTVDTALGLLTELRTEVARHRQDSDAARALLAETQIELATAQAALATEVARNAKSQSELQLDVRERDVRIDRLERRVEDLLQMQGLEDRRRRG